MSSITKNTMVPIATLLGVVVFAVYCDRRARDAESDARLARQEAQQAAARIERLELRLDSRIDALKQGIEGTMLPVRDMEYWIGLFSARNSAGNLTVPPLRPPR